MRETLSGKMFLLSTILLLHGKKSLDGCSDSGSIPEQAQTGFPVKHKLAKMKKQRIKWGSFPFTEKKETFHITAKCEKDAEDALRVIKAWRKKK